MSSGEQFDYGLIRTFTVLGLSVAFVKRSNANKCKIKIIKVSNTGSTSQYIINIIVPLNYDSRTFISLLNILCMKLHPKFIILPRMDAKLFLFSLAKMRKLSLKKLLWYSPTPAFIYKVPYLIRNCNNFAHYILLFIKAICSAIFTPILPLLYDYVLLRDTLTYRFLYKFYRRRKILLLPPVWNYNVLTIESNYLSADEIIKKYKPYILITISLRRGKCISSIELYYFKLATLLAKFLSNLNFVIVGSSIEDIKQIDNELNFPENLHVLGRIYGVSYQQLLLNATAVLAYVLLPGNSNRVMESITYGKPTIVSKIAQIYHPGLKHFYNCFVLDLDSKCFVKLKSVLNNNAILEMLGKKASFLNNIYMHLCCKRLEQLFRELC
ncbi:MAG: hypothetical protein QXF79_01095 [Ignisphaera sp.]